MKSKTTHKEGVLGLCTYFSMTSNVAPIVHPIRTILLSISSIPFQTNTTLALALALTHLSDNAFPAPIWRPYIRNHSTDQPLRSHASVFW